MRSSVGSTCVNISADITYSSSVGYERGRFRGSRRFLGLPLRAEIRIPVCFIVGKRPIQSKIVIFYRNNRFRLSRKPVGERSRTPTVALDIAADSLRNISCASFNVIFGAGVALYLIRRLRSQGVHDVTAIDSPPLRFNGLTSHRQS